MVEAKRKALERVARNERRAERRAALRAKKLGGASMDIGGAGSGDENAEQVAAAQAAIDRLSRTQREALQASAAARNALDRDLIEERILQQELAAEGGPLSARPPEAPGDYSY